MPVYEYYCENCKSEYEMIRPCLTHGRAGSMPKLRTAGAKVVVLLRIQIQYF